MQEARDVRLSDVMTIEQTAEHLGLSVEGTYKAVKRGELQAYKLGRMLLIERSEVASYKAARDRILGRRQQTAQRERIT